MSRPHDFTVNFTGIANVAVWQAVLELGPILAPWLMWTVVNPCGSAVDETVLRVALVLNETVALLAWQPAAVLIAVTVTEPVPCETAVIVTDVFGFVTLKTRSAVPVGRSKEEGVPVAVIVRVCRLPTVALPFPVPVVL